MHVKSQTWKAIVKNLSKQYHYEELAIILRHSKINTKESPSCDFPFKKCKQIVMVIAVVSEIDLLKIVQWNVHMDLNQFLRRPN